MNAFTPGRQQDASPAIRGFWYQIELTLLRWLDLPEGDVLYLECGEDIDRLLHAKADESWERILEQVKVRGRAITLRSPEALKALADFAAHLNANPGQRLRFCFTTTASPGRESDSPVGAETRGLETWECLRRKESWTPDDEATLDKLANLIERCPKPTDCRDDAWNGLISILGGTGIVPLREFVSRFEWSCGGPPPEKMIAIIYERLARLGGCTGPDDPVCEQRHDQLITGLLTLLARPGEKRITANDLKAAVARRTLTERDRERISIVEGMITSLSASVAEIDLAGALPIVFGTAAGELRAMGPVLSLPAPPPLVSKLSRRRTTVDEMARAWPASGWLSLHGSVWIGKSHLGSLLAESMGGVVLCVSMRGLSTAEAERALQRVFSSRDGLGCLKGPGAGVVFLDDLPTCERGSRLEALLLALTHRASENGRAIVSTSRRALPSTTGDAFGPGFVAREAPPFSDQDARELFLAHGCDDRFLSPDRVSTMNALCRGHPVLITALARYIAVRRTDPDRALMDCLLAGGHRDEVDKETARAILQSVEIERCRDLLYRLAAVNFPMLGDEIRQVAAVQPALHEPTACIARLDGLWLRRTSDSRYEVSPLTVPLGRDLPGGLRRSLHGAAARIVLQRRRIGTNEFVYAIDSLLAAGDEQLAAMHLLHGCMTWPARAHGYGELGILLRFPIERDHRLRPAAELPIRSAQAITAAIEGGDASPYLARIETLVQNVSRETAVGASLGGMMFLVSTLNIPTRLAVFGASLIERFMGSSDLPAELAPELLRIGGCSHLVLASANVRTWDDLDAFIDMLGALPQSRRVDVVNTLGPHKGLRLLFLNPLFDENAGLTPASLERLTRARERCLSLNLTREAAYATGAILVIFGEYDKDIERVLTEAKQARSLLAGDEASIAIVNSVVGQQLLSNHRPADGLQALSAALADSTHLVGLERGERLVDAILAAWDAGEDPGAYADQLADLLRNPRFGTSTLRCQMHAQVAVVRWRQARRKDTATHLGQATLTWFDIEDGVRSRQLGSGLAHALSYYACIAETGEPPPAGPDGGPFVEPPPRMFSGMNEGMAGMWKARQGPALVWWLLARLAGAVGLEEEASGWLDRALELATQQKVPSLLAALGPRAVASALRLRDWESALEAAVSFGRAKVLVDERGPKCVEDDVVFEPLEAPGDAERRSRAERGSLLLLASAVVAELGGRLLPGDAAGEELARVIEAFSCSAELAAAWRALAKAVRVSTTATATIHEHREILEESADADSSGPQLVAHALMALRPDGPLEQSVHSQAGVLMRLDREFRKLELPVSGYAEAVCRFWSEAVEREPFSFRAPRQTAGDLASLGDREPLARAKGALRIVSGALSVPLARETHNWLCE